jgi:hypothetical protein
VYAHDRDGHTLLIGSPTITVNNASATKPFGTLDTPVAGETKTGTFPVFGWALTPKPAVIPTDATTIWVVIDGERFGHPVYNQFRSDVATLFPGYLNSAGPVGYYYVNTRKLANGMHSIAWSVTDNQSRTDGLGSRVFWTQNAEAPASVTATAGTPQSAVISTPFGAQLRATVRNSANAPVTGALVRFTAPRTGASLTFPTGGTTLAVLTDANGVATAPAITANGTQGSYSVTATVFGLPPATFALSNTAPSGGGQIGVSSVSVGRNLQRTLTVTLSAPAGAGGVPVTITSADPARVTLGGAAQGSLQVPVAEGGTQVSVFVQGMGGGTGAVQVTAAAPGYTNGTGTVTVTNSGFVLAGPNDVGASFSTYTGLTTPMTVYSARLDATNKYVEKQPLRQGLTGVVNVNVSSTSAGTVIPSSVALGPGDPSAPFNFTAISGGTATITAAAPAGYTAVSGGANVVTASVLASGLLMPSALTIGRNLQVPAAIGLNGSVPTGGASLTLTSSDSSKLRFSLTPNTAGTPSLTIVVPENAHATPDFYIQAVGATGPVTMSAQAPGFGTGQTPITITPSGIVFTTPFGGVPNPILAAVGGSAATVTVYTARLDANGVWVQTQELAGGTSATVTVSSSTPTVGTLSPPQITIQGGTISGTTSFQPGSQGSTSLSVNVPATPTGFATPAAAYRSVAAMVTTARIVLTADGVPVGRNLQYEGAVILNQAAPAGGVAVTLRSNSAQLLLAPTPSAAGQSTLQVTVPAGGTSVPYYVQSLGASGTATYTASD